jgi:plastocyanin
MKIIVFTALALLGMTVLLSQDANAQLEPNKAFALTGNGFTISTDSVLDSNIDLLFTTNKIKNNINFDLQNGLIVIDQTDLSVSDFSGSLLKNGKLFRISLKATDPEGNKFTVSMLGRLVVTTPTDSIYTITGTLTDSSKKLTKMIFTTKATEFTQTPAEVQKSEITVKILKGSADPSQRTYVEQTGGFGFKYFSEDRISIPTGGKVTFVNEDTASHSLKSGTANYVSRHKTFTEDGKISSGEIQPGKSWSVTFNEPGFFRLFDENYQWMDTTVFVSYATSSQTLGNAKPIN